MKTKTTLKTAIRNAHTPGPLNSALSALCGCPVGGWGETERAWRRVEEECPFRAERAWTVEDLIDAVLCVDHADRYRWRD